MSFSDPDLSAEPVEPGGAASRLPWRLIAVSAVVLATLCGVCLAVWGPCVISCGPGTTTTQTPSAGPVPSSAPASTPSGAAVITILTATAPGGSSLIVNGSGFAPNEDVEVRVDGVTVGRARADAGGSFATYVIPVRWSPRRQVTVDVRGVTSGRSATGQVTA
jgi:hypothetical protein